MTNYLTTPLENKYESQIVGEIQAGTTAPFDITVKKAISFTPASGGFYAVLEPGTSKEETFKISAVSGTTWTVSERGIPTAKGGASTATTHGGGAKIIISDNWSNFDDIATAVATKSDKAGDTFTGLIQFSGTNHAGIKMISLTTAQRNALTPANGMVVYDTTDSLLYQYVGGAWGTIDTGTATPNASETVAGKVEQSTLAQQGAGTETGETGAPLFLNPKNTVKTSSGAGDENKIPVLNSSGKIANGFIDSEKLTKSLTCGEAINGATLPVAVYQSSATNKILACDGNDLTKLEFIGFAITNSTDTNPITIVTSGIVSGFTGLSEGLRYYVQDDKTIGTAIGTYECMVGIAVSETELLIMKGADEYIGSVNASGTADGSTITSPAIARKVIIKIVTPLAGAGLFAISEITLTRKGRTVGTFIYSDNAKIVQVEATWVSETITLVSQAGGSTAAMNGTCVGYFYK